MILCCVRLCIKVAGFVCLLGSAYASESAPSLAHFLIPVCSLVGDYAQREATGASSASETRIAISNTFGVAGADWTILTGACQRMNSSIANVGNEARALHQQIRAQGREVDQSFVVKYNLQRDSMLGVALSQIRSKMSPQGWEALRRYLAIMQQNTIAARLQ